MALCYSKDTMECYFHVLVFYTGYFIKEIENIFSRVPIHYRNTRGSLGELEIAWKHSPYGFVFPPQFLVLSNFHSCFYNSGSNYARTRYLRFIANL